MKLSEVLGVLRINRIVVRVCAEGYNAEYELCKEGYNPLQVMDSVRIVKMIDPDFLNRIVVDIVSTAANAVLVDVY